MTRPLAVALLSGWLAASACACAAFDESRLGSAEDAGAQCPLTLPPPRPTGADTDGVPERVYAIHRPVIDQSGDRWRTIGYDLDGFCSQEPDIRVECVPPSPMAPLELDGVGGIDNSFGHNISEIILIDQPDFEESAREGVARGLGAILLRVSGWNGEPDDPRVSTALIQSVFGSGEALSGFTDVDVSKRLLRVDGVLREIPAWDGEDYFWARPDSFLEGDPSRPLITDDNAYVSDGVLVVLLPSRFPFVLTGNNEGARFTLSDAVFTVELDADQVTARHAVLAGRWDTDDLLEVIAAAGYCPGTPDYNGLSLLLRLTADIRTTPGTGGMGVECDALSFALVFDEGIVATIAGTFEPFPLTDPCAMTPP